MAFLRHNDDEFRIVTALGKIDRVFIKNLAGQAQFLLQKSFDRLRNHSFPPQNGSRVNDLHGPLLLEIRYSPDPQEAIFQGHAVKVSNKNSKKEGICQYCDSLIDKR